VSSHNGIFSLFHIMVVDRKDYSHCYNWGIGHCDINNAACDPRMRIRNTRIAGPLGKLVHIGWLYLLNAKSCMTPQPCCNQPLPFKHHDGNHMLSVQQYSLNTMMTSTGLIKIANEFREFDDINYCIRGLCVRSKSLILSAKYMALRKTATGDAKVLFSNAENWRFKYTCSVSVWLVQA
jgi:hypothetical protein